MKIKIKLSRIVFFGAIILLFVLMVAGNKLFRSYSEPKGEYRYFALFSEVASMVKTNYVEEVNPDSTFPGAYSAMLASLDNLSSYLNKEQTALYNLFLLEKTCSSGIYGTRVADYFLVTDVLKNSPAETADLKPGDFIKAVNGKSIYGLSFWEMALALASEKPTDMELVVLKEKAMDPVKITLQTVLHPSSEESLPIIEKITADILRVNLQRIDNTSAVALKEALTQSHTPILTKPLNLIIDLRRYRGGNLNSFIQLSQMLLPKKVSLQLKHKGEVETLVLGSSTIPHYRTVIIINPSTILYGELLAALFKATSPDVTLVGVQTHGFISQLKHVPLPDGSSILITDGLFFLENEKPVNIGLTPDVKVDDQDFGTITDRCIAILNGSQKYSPNKNEHKNEQEREQEREQEQEQEHERNQEKK